MLFHVLGYGMSII